jgi:dTMP kinase
LFVTFEGIEASGKSTLLEALAERLRSEGVSLVTTREPGGTPLGARIRQLVLAPDERVAPAAEALLMTADRAQHVAELIRPALERGTWVLCDRFATATLAYQGYGHGVPLEDLRRVIAVATEGLEPDVILLVDIPIEVSQSRVASRSAQSGRLADRMEREDGAFHTRVRDGYLALARENPRMHVLDGLQPVESLLRRALEIVRSEGSEG